MNNRYMSNNIERNATWRVGVYCRLSKDDELTGESASISNQRDILVNYCQSQGWQVVDVFQDDGYTGLNTDRPDLQRLLKACEKGLVNLVITKDQSRLGRNHVQTGFLMEEFFPKHGGVPQISGRRSMVAQGLCTFYGSEETLRRYFVERVG